MRTLHAVWLGAALFALAALRAASPAAAEMAVQTWGLDDHAAHAKSLKIADADNGAAIIEIDLKALPQNVRVYRARLFMERSHVTIPPRARGEEPKPIGDDALVNCEVYPGTKAAGNALAIVAPWYDCLDATDAVRKAAGGACTFFVKPLPDWQRASTRLEVATDSTTANPPPQVAGVKAVHRAGQTFITWTEIEDLAAKDSISWKEYQQITAAAEKQRRVRYAVYRGTKPITAATLPEAERIALVTPLSGWNVNGRNSERPIDDKLANQYALIHGHWNPFADARVDGPFGADCPLDRFVIADGSAPLARNTGLYVHTASEQGKAYYAVAASVNGTENTAAFSKDNATENAVAESPAESEPVFQRELPKPPFWSYPEKRLHYVRWVGPDCGNKPYQYYNWSVAVPDALGKGVPLELSLHRNDRSYWRTQYRIERDSIVVTPYDFPLATWWYGYHESLGTLKSFEQGAIRNYTERRVMWFVDWAAKKWPVDRSRIFVTAMRRSSGGAGASSGNRGAGTSGALHLGLRYPDVFNTVQIGTDFRPDYATDTPDNIVLIWGKPEWAVKTASGKSVWDELNLIRLVLDRPASADLPLVTMTGKDAIGPQLQFYAALLAKGQPFMSKFGTWGGGKLLPVSASGTWPGSMIRADVRRGRPLAAFRAVVLEKPSKYSGPEIPKDLAKVSGDINAALRWGDDAIDKPDRAELAIWAEGRWASGTGVDVIPRRLSQFKVQPGKTYVWTFGDQKGEVTVGDDRLLVIPALKITGEHRRLIITAK